jgi:hypothetical protein
VDDCLLVDKVKAVEIFASFKQSAATFSYMKLWMFPIGLPNQFHEAGSQNNGISR